MHKWFLVLAMLSTHRLCIFAENNTFIPTKEWQEIKEGQGIPRGLHVRINMRTGMKEAKLLDESEEKSDGALSTLPENSEEKPVEGTAHPHPKISKRMEEALKNLPKEPMAIDYSPDRLDQIKREYKSYKELKKSYDEMRYNFRSDAEIITLLLQEYNNVSRTEPHKGSLLDDGKKTRDLLGILENLKHLAHQIDNALWFIDEGGLDTMLLPMMVNHTDVNLRVQAMRVLGALTQNNPKAQIKVFEKNFGSHLAQILTTSTHTDELSAALYAFGSLLRKFPLAQQLILSKLGTQALVAVMAKECELKIKAKSATLISDLIVEKELVLAESSREGGDAQAAAQYAHINLPEWLLNNGYCDTLDNIITANLYELLEQPDLTEYFVQALKNTQSFCSVRWSQSPQLRHILLTLINRFVRSGEDYRMDVAQLIADLVKTLYKKNRSTDEL